MPKGENGFVVRSQATPSPPLLSTGNAVRGVLLLRPPQRRTWWIWQRLLRDRGDRRPTSEQGNTAGGRQTTANLHVTAVYTVLRICAVHGSAFTVTLDSRMNHESYICMQGRLPFAQSSSVEVRFVCMSRDTTRSPCNGIGARLSGARSHLAPSEVEA